MRSVAISVVGLLAHSAYAMPASGSAVHTLELEGSVDAMGAGYEQKCADLYKQVKQKEFGDMCCPSKTIIKERECEMYANYYLSKGYKEDGGIKVTKYGGHVDHDERHTYPTGCNIVQCKKTGKYQIVFAATPGTASDPKDIIPICYKKKQPLKDNLSTATCKSKAAAGMCKTCPRTPLQCKLTCSEEAKKPDGKVCAKGEKIIKGKACPADKVVFENKAGHDCISGAPHYDPEGMVCANDNKPTEAYCSYDVGPKACVRCESDKEEPHKVPPTGNDGPGGQCGNPDWCEDAETCEESAIECHETYMKKCCKQTCGLPCFK